MTNNKKGKTVNKLTDADELTDKFLKLKTGLFWQIKYPKTKVNVVHIIFINISS